MTTDADTCQICAKGFNAFRCALDAYHHEYDGVEDEEIAECEERLRVLKSHMVQMHDAIETF